MNWLGKSVHPCPKSGACGRPRESLRLRAMWTSTALPLCLCCRIPWRCAPGRMSSRASSLHSAISTPWWRKGASLVPKAGTVPTPLTLETSLSLWTCCTITWRPAQRCVSQRPALWWLLTTSDGVASAESPEKSPEMPFLWYLWFYSFTVQCTFVAAVPLTSVAAYKS